MGPSQTRLRPHAKVRTLWLRCPRRVARGYHSAGPHWPRPGAHTQRPRRAGQRRV